MWQRCHLGQVADDFDRIKRFASKEDAQLFFVYLPGPEEIYVPLLSSATNLNGCATSAISTYKDGNLDFDKFFNQYMSALGDNAAMLFDATPYLRDFASQGEKLAWTTDIHPNALGHRCIGEYIARVVGELPLVFAF